MIRLAVWLCVWIPALALGELRSEIEFARPGGVALTMDAFVPESGPAPAAIWVHGGGFVSGDKKPHPGSLFDTLQQKGWAWFSVNYRLAPQHVFPAHTDDAEAAVAYIKQHAREFKVDPRRLVLFGASAGGHIVSFVGAHHKPGNDIAAVVSFFGEHDLVDRVHPKGPCMIDGKVVEHPGPLCLSPGLAKYLGVTAESPSAEEVVRKASPSHWAKKNMPPYLLIHGTKDFAVPFEQSERMMDTMKKIGARCELIRVEGGGHGYGAWDRDPNMSGYRQQMYDWLARTIR